MKHLIYILLLILASCASPTDNVKVGQVWEYEFKDSNKDPFKTQKKNVATIVAIESSYVKDKVDYMITESRYVKYKVEYMIRNSKADKWEIEIVADKPFIVYESERVNDFISDYTLVKDVPSK